MENEKIKWSYDSKYKEWYANNVGPHGNEGYNIKKTEIYGKARYELTQGSFKHIATCRKLSSAKEIARLIEFG